ncbi:MAG: hypothetical protein HOP15_07490 [Planctomycetes bacterium]|nr:hypothetical protein [Planctomycetota bacterium]
MLSQPLPRAALVGAGARAFGTSAWTVAPPASPPPRTLTVLANTAASKNDNFRAQGGGYSVSFTRNPTATYHLYATFGYHNRKWKLPQQELRSLYQMTECTPTGPCYYKKDPRDQEPRCSTDAISYLWKRVPCASSTVACQNNDRWNAWPGLFNVTTFPTIGIWPLSGANEWGTAGHRAIIDHQTINNVQLQPAGTNCKPGSVYCPPKTGLAGTVTPTGCGVCASEKPCSGAHPYNPDEWATGAANGKVVPYRYADGSTRWFMAFNSMIHNDGTASDIWRILWATSPNGGNWTIHPDILFRSIFETIHPNHGFLVTDMFTDADVLTGNDYFYVVFNDVGANYSYLVRSAVDPVNMSTIPGYTTWEVAVGTMQWQPIAIGQLQDLRGAAHLFEIGTSEFGVRQASITRVFDSATPGSTSRYIAIASWLNTPPQLWSTPNLSTMFTFESNVVLDPSIQPGDWGWEFGFTHHADNTASNPRTIKTGFDLWVTEDETTNPPILGTAGRARTVTRRTAVLTP